MADEVADDDKSCHRAACAVQDRSDSRAHPAPSVPAMSHLLPSGRRTVLQGRLSFPKPASEVLYHGWPFFEPSPILAPTWTAYFSRWAGGCATSARQRA
jgi:hypothetical protein